MVFRLQPGFVPTQFSPDQCQGYEYWSNAFDINIQFETSKKHSQA